MKILLFLVLVVFSGCDSLVVVDREEIETGPPKEFEILDKKTVRKVLKPSVAEDIVPEGNY